jgi:hypothetical protein
MAILAISYGSRAEGYLFEVLPKPINPEKLLQKLKEISFVKR